MQSSVERVLSIYELTEGIIRQLNCPVEIIRAQRVCRNWRDVIQTSPVLYEACWYRPHSRDTHEQPAGRQTWRLNPVFNQIGVSVQLPPGVVQQYGKFNLRERIYDKPGSWTTMLATQPPCQRIEVECHGDYSGGDETMYYLIESMIGCLLMGEVMAVLAECQNRQECGVDRWAGARHYTGQLRPVTEDEWSDADWPDLLEKMPDDVSIKVALQLPFGSGGFPAFSLRRLYPDAELDRYPAGGKCFLHEMILHKMVSWNGVELEEYQWDWWNHGGKNKRPLCKMGEYKANLLAVKEHQEGYLANVPR